mgnify:CR=1 FL=1
MKPILKLRFPARSLFKKPLSEASMIRRLSLVSIVGNTLLSAFKLYAGLAGSSGAMISDAVHSMSDVASTVVAACGVRMSRKEADRKHPYGHDRMECVAAVILGSILFATGLGIGKTGLSHILFWSWAPRSAPDAIALWAAAISILVKESMFWYTRYYARILGSSAFMADAWHHRSDALSSIGAFAGIGGAMLGMPILDSVASLAICLCILKVAYDILDDAFQKMLDDSCGEEFEQDLSDFICAQSQEISIDLLHTRRFGSKLYVDLELAMDGEKSLQEAHALAHQIHDQIERQYADVKHVMIHVNPW